MDGLETPLVQATKETKTNTAKSIYSRLESFRWVTLERARDCSSLTLPALIPPEWTTDQVDLPTPYQSIGARGVNNLSSKLLLAMFPPGQPFFRLKVNEAVAQQLGGKLSQVNAKLCTIEQIITDKTETSHTRPIMAELIKHLIVGGNAILHVPTHECMRFFRLDQYVIVRDGIGRPLQVVIKETVVSGSLKPQHATACHCVQTDPYAKVDIYTFIEWDYELKQVRHKQEINDLPVPDSDGMRPLDKSEWIPLRWIAVPGRDYGRGHVEEYLGDLRSMEILSQAIVQFAAAASKIVLLVHPNAVTSVKELSAAETGDAIVGAKTDIDVFQLEKEQDFQAAGTTAANLEQRLSYAFLVQTGTTRNAERVTAEEIRAVAQELEDALGGVYTVLAQELQLPFVARLMAILQEAREIPALPKKALSPVIVTGFEALGRNHALNKLRSMLADLTTTFGQQVVSQKLDFEEIATRMANGYGVEKPQDLWLDEKTVQQNQQNQTMQQATIKAAPQIAPALMAKAMGGQGGAPQAGAQPAPPAQQ
jgi:hypothetical protein